jgi:hypothetical protein
VARAATYGEDLSPRTELGIAPVRAAVARPGVLRSASHSDAGALQTARSPSDGGMPRGAAASPPHGLPMAPHRESQPPDGMPTIPDVAPPFAPPHLPRASTPSFASYTYSVPLPVLGHDPRFPRLGSELPHGAPLVPPGAQLALGSSISASAAARSARPMIDPRGLPRGAPALTMTHVIRRERGWIVSLVVAAIVLAAVAAIVAATRGDAAAPHRLGEPPPSAVGSSPAGR